MNTRRARGARGNRERQKVWQDVGDGEASVGRWYANRSTSSSPLAHFFWMDDDGKAQLQEAALPWKLSLVVVPSNCCTVAGDIYKRRRRITMVASRRRRV